MTDPKTEESTGVEITLSGPAKVGGKLHPAGATMTVTPEIHAQLIAAGVVNGEGGGEAAVESADALTAMFPKTLAAANELAKERDDALAEIEELKAVRDELAKELDATVAEVSRLQAMCDDLAKTVVSTNSELDQHEVPSDVSEDVPTVSQKTASTKAKG